MRWRAALLLAVLALASCGGDAGIGTEASGALQPIVGRVREAAAAGDRAAADQALAQLRQQVEDLYGRREITEDQAIEIRAGIKRVEEKIATTITTIATTTTTTTTTTTAAPPRREDKDEDDDKGKGRGKGGDD